MQSSASPSQYAHETRQIEPETADLALARVPVTSTAACAAKVRLLQRTLGMEFDRAPHVQLAPDEMIIASCLKTVLEFLEPTKV